MLESWECPPAGSGSQRLPSSGAATLDSGEAISWQARSNGGDTCVERVQQRRHELERWEQKLRTIRHMACLAAASSALVRTLRGTTGAPSPVKNGVVL